MSADVASRAFDPFFTTKDGGSGTGLGLSQVYAMAKQAGGTPRIKRTDPSGTTISLFLKEVDVVDTSRETADEILAPGLARQSVLVIDDDPDIRQVLADSLEMLGKEVRLSGDGAAGLEAIRQARPDILLLDFAMPGINGAEVADLVRKMMPELPIVFVTGYSDTAAIEAAVGGAAILLKKPLTADDLQSVLRESLQVARAG